MTLIEIFELLTILAATLIFAGGVYAIVNRKIEPRTVNNKSVNDLAYVAAFSVKIAATEILRNTKIENGVAHLDNATFLAKSEELFKRLSPIVGFTYNESDRDLYSIVLYATMMLYYKENAPVPTGLSAVK